MLIYLGEILYSQNSSYASLKFKDKVKVGLYTIDLEKFKKIS